MKKQLTTCLLVFLTLVSLSIADEQPSLSDEEQFVNSVDMTLKLIPAGEFLMGSSHSPEETQKAFEKYWEFSPGPFLGEVPHHRVRLTKPFFMGIHEVTVGQFRKFVTETGYQSDGWDILQGWRGERGLGFSEDWSWQKPGFEQAENHPVCCVSWQDAIAFCKWLTQQEGRKYRLPSEAEWEYACRAGTTSLYWNGNDPEKLNEVANVLDSSAKGVVKAMLGEEATIRSSDGSSFTAPVGSYRSNAFGLFNMHGNVSEWCNDGYSDGYYKTSPSEDPPGYSIYGRKVFRGGNWVSAAAYARSAYREGPLRGERSCFVGFRVVCETE